jgi:hypothetical protein
LKKVHDDATGREDDHCLVVIGEDGERPAGLQAVAAPDLDRDRDPAEFVRLASQAAEATTRPSATNVIQ